MRKKTLTAFFVLSMFLVCVTCAQSREAIQLDDYLTELPFSPGIVAGEMLYLSGAVGVRPGQQKPEGDISRQTEVTLENLGLVLRKAGLDFADVVSATVYLADARHYSAMNEVYRRFFPQNPPARATVEGAVVVKDALVEISAIAVKKGVARRYLTPASWPQPAAPFSWGVLVGEKVLFLSGLVGSEPASGAFESDFTLQTRQVFQNMGALLKAAEMDFADLVSTRVYLSDSRDFAAMNDVYTDVLPEQRPVRATVQARLANPGLKIEIQSIAVKGEERVDPIERGQTPFSTAVRVGKTVHVAGLVGRGEEGFAPGDLREQVRQTFRNLKAALSAAGAGLDNVVDVTVFLSDVRFFGAMNEVYRQELPPGAPPARATVATPLMSPEALVEIMMTAQVP